MARTPEGLVKNHIRKMLKQAGAYSVMPIGTGYGNSGVPDILVCHKGRFIAIEAKSGNNQPTALQWKNLKDISNAGGIALVINEDNMHDLEVVLDAEQPRSAEAL